MPVMTALRVMLNAHLGSPTSPVRQSTRTRNAAPAPPMMVFCTIRPSAGPCPLASLRAPALNPRNPVIRISPPRPTS